MNNNYLLLKVSVLEHVSGNEACRIGEDFLTIICDSPPAPPLPNVTPTITPSSMQQPDTPLNNAIIVQGLNSAISTSSNDGITLTSYGGTALLYNSRTGASTISSMSLILGSPSGFTEVGRIVFVDAYLNDKFNLQYNSNTYRLTFVSGPTYL